MRNTIYRVEFQINSLLNDEFDFKDDALEWAAEHLDDKPVVRAIDIEYPDEFGAEPIIHEEEEIFHYPVEEEVSDQEEDDLDARLAALEADEDDPYNADEFDGQENLNEVIQVDKPTRALQYEFTDYDDEGELSEPAQKLDKAVADLSKDEAAYNTEEAEKIRQEYQNLEAACIEAEKAQRDAFIDAMDNYERKLNDPVSLTLDQINERNAAIAADENYKKAREATRAAVQAYRQFGIDHHAEIFGIYDTMANFSDMVKDAKRAGYKRYKELTAKESLEEGIISEIDSVAAKWNSIDSTKQEALEEDVILFDPFGCDFSECEPMEVCKDNHRADCCDDLCQSPADFLRELAAELGIADEVEISEKNVEEPIESVPIDDGNGGVKDVCPNCGNEIPLWKLQGQNSEISDEAKVDVAPEAEVAADPEDVVPEEVKANEEPNVEVQVEDEEPAKEISKCHVCPECGKEICECDKQKLDEAAFSLSPAVNKVVALIKSFADTSLSSVGKKLQEEGYRVFTNKGNSVANEFNPAFLYVYNEKGKEIIIWTAKKTALGTETNSAAPQDLTKLEMAPVKVIIRDTTFNIISAAFARFSNKFSQIISDIKDGVKEIGSQIKTGIDNLKNKKQEVAEGCNEEICECGNKELEEDTHPKSAQPPVSEEEAHKAAQTVANAEGKPVIYGYHGKDHHGSARFFEIDQIVCDDLKKCTKDVMTKYHPSGSVYVAYPDDPYEDKERGIFEPKFPDVFEEEMSDEEFAEALKKGLEEKHAKK